MQFDTQQKQQPEGHLNWKITFTVLLKSFSNWEEPFFTSINSNDS